MILVISTILFFLIFYLKNKEVESNKKRAAINEFAYIKKSYFSTLKLNNVPFLKKLQLGMQYYSNQINDSKKDNLDGMYTQVADDIVQYSFMPEFKAILTVFFAAAYNPFKNTSYEDKLIKIAEILKTWEIDMNKINDEFNDASSFVMLLNGKINLKALFKFIDSSRHQSIILLCCDIVFSGKKLETYQENYLKELSQISPDANVLIANSITYYENRGIATSIRWEHSEEEYQTY